MSQILSPEYRPLAPEDVEIANCYLQTLDVKITAEKLGIPLDKVTAYINKKEVQSYINEVFLNTGYRNRFKLGQVLDDLIDAKLQEMYQTDSTSKKDIAELLELVIKMRKDERDHELKKQTNITKQTNIQINNNPYSEFTAKLLDLPE